MNKGIILFDGVCNLCNGLVQFVLKNEKDKRLLFASLQSNSGLYLLEKYQINNYNLETIVYIENEKVYIKSKAILKIFGHLKFPWPYLKVFEFVPQKFSDKIYMFISQNRYKLFGKKLTCWTPGPEIKSRFL